MEEIIRSLDDIVTGEDTVHQVHELKNCNRGFQRAHFEFHKRNSNVPELETYIQLTKDIKTYAKEQMGVKTKKAKLLGIP